MPQYTTPGVYVEEVASGSAPIAGASTSTPGFIGFVGSGVRMPLVPGQDNVRSTQADYYKPYLVTSWDDFRRLFGDFQGEVPLEKSLAQATTEPDKTKRSDFLKDTGNWARPERNGTLAHAVYAFFNNGGSRCWVVATDRKVDGVTWAAKKHSQWGTYMAATETAPTPPAASTLEGTLKTNAYSALADALEALRPIEEISLMVAPGVTDNDFRKLVYQHCESAGDRFAILDGLVVSDTDALTTATTAGNLGISNYAALYFPWITVVDPATGDTVPLPPSGHVAGVYARTDATRGVHKAPAAEVVRGAAGVTRLVSRAEQGALNTDGVNVIRNLDGNIKIWGARTLGGDANGEWKYLSVRRTFLFLRKSIDRGTQWAVFEPNTPELWAKITRNVTAFLNGVWNSGALFGATAQEAFFVRCDATLNTPDVRDLGQVITEIGVSVVKPAEFVIFRISQWSGPGK